MKDYTDIDIKKICCTCLSEDRVLYQLCRVKNGINYLYLLLSYDSEAYREGFFKDTANLQICWECRSMMCRISRFSQQACYAQRQLTSITDGRIDINHKQCLSQLSNHLKTEYDVIISESDTYCDNFIDCGPYDDLKTQSEEDIPLSELHNNFITEEEGNTAIKYKKRERVKKKKHFSSVRMSEEELKDVIKSRKMEEDFLSSEFKCDSCVEIFESKEELESHNISFHNERLNHIQCDICLVYIDKALHVDHRENHYTKYRCLRCEFSSYSLSGICSHLLDVHGIYFKMPVKRKKGLRKPALKTTTKASSTSKDKRTPFGYLCKECNLYFDNKNQRWNHVQRHHREGYKCTTCGKRFAFRNNLTRHEQNHISPPPRTECTVCHKQIRVDLLKIHARIHTQRQQYCCLECSKYFVSRASYEHHLKYTQAHAAVDTLKFKCSMCDKGYRSRSELRDHVNYKHMSKTRHKCPVCGKGLASPRGITRHVRRAHQGVKESARDKICQQCGKAFRDKKGLREHELIHTGERPLSCEICGCTFRQNAALYTHRKRVHKICRPAKTLQVLV